MNQNPCAFSKKSPIFPLDSRSDFKKCQNLPDLNAKRALTNIVTLRNLAGFSLTYLTKQDQLNLFDTLMTAGLIFLFVLGFWLWHNHFVWKKNGGEIEFYFMLQVICIYHFLFVFIFHEYIQKYGGDANSYWELTAVKKTLMEHTWWDYWGDRSAWIEWINYWPAKILGWDIFYGHLFYASVSYLGIHLLAKLWQNSLPSPKNKARTILYVLPFFLPNLHFWTSGIGKEAWLLLGLALSTKGWKNWNKNYVWGILGVLLSFWVRPANGAILGFITIILALGKASNNKKIPWWGWVSAGLFLGLMSFGVIRYMHLDSLTLDSLRRFSSLQFASLEKLGAASQMPMQEYGWLKRLFTVAFRPIWENNFSVTYLISGMENALALFFTLMAVWGFLKARIRKKMPWWIWAGLAYCIALLLVHTLTLNNLGIMMRMKSVGMFFVYLAGTWSLLGTNKYSTHSGSAGMN